ncbi:MAG: efflux RND transporter permease subunit [Gammaproteobacteria bacterium]|nr:MAG: efflux RND transporter permease subunit [Gammaproteobacteria bacterium]TLY86541.1 MAG: efflux RND transporter permease subunit [Gammaproteobacteria bacterium]
MWIVRLALRRPYTFLVLAILISLLGGFAISRTPTDIFPNIKIPVVATIWRYTGLSPEEMATRLVLQSERTAQTIVNDVEHTESQNLSGTSVVKYFFQPNVNEELSFAQITGVSQTQLRFAPPGTTPPFILAYNASSVPILQLALSSGQLSEAQLFDLGNSIIRTGLSTVAGASMPWPYGGLQRQVQVDLDPDALRAQGLSGNDVAAAFNAQNSILPAGTQKIGDREYFVTVNANPKTVAELNDLPITTRSGSVIYVRDVAHVRDGYPPQTNIVRRDGRRGVLMSVLKTGSASTLDIIRAIKQRLPRIRAQLPQGFNIDPVGDQSLFVRAAISGVVREAVIAAALTALMILLFLGSWRSTFIIAVSIPLSILASIVCLSALGETINIMTLGGLALAVGILVDDATVTIENINWHLERGEEVEAAILNGAHEIAVPAFVSTLAICIVFVPMFMLAGIARFLFVPLAEAVVFAMLASYLLSRTLVPTLAKYWLQRHDAHAADQTRGLLGHLQRLQARFEQWFARVRERYHALLERALAAGTRFALPFLAAMAATALLAFPFGRYLPGLGQDFFPSVDAGQIKLHLRAPTGIRIDETAALCDRVEATIRETVPAREISTIVDNIGVPYSGINLSYSTSAPVGPGDADIFVNLTPDHRPTAQYVHALRAKLTALYPATRFAFLPADIVSQILNFGLPAPLDVQVAGLNVDANRHYANALLARMHGIPGVVDLRIQQDFDYPTLNVNVDRSKAALLGLSETDVASDLLISLSGSSQTTLSFWIDPKSGSQYNVVAQTPQFRLASLSDLATTPVTGGNGGNGGGGGGGSQMLANLASFSRGVSPAVVSHYDATPVIDIYGAIEGTDLGFIAAQINRLVADTQHSLPRGSQVTVRGQVKTMTDSFTGLLAGLAGAVVLVYLLIVVNFQSWRDPFIIITALPAALAGIVWLLFLTHTPVSVPALTGAIMCMGVATANSVLVVSFARERMNAGDDAAHAALQAGVTRFRPVLMTALAMIIGMVPMALGLGEGGEQNAPLGRAVIGGLVFATVATLFFVPTVFSLVHGRRSR